MTDVLSLVLFAAMLRCCCQFNSILYIYICIHTYTYIYIYRERERESERDLFIELVVLINCLCIKFIECIYLNYIIYCCYLFID